MSLMDNVKQLDSKQKMMLVATIGCLGLVFYLAYATFFPASDAPAATNTPAVITPVTQTPTPAPVATEATPAVTASTTPAAISPSLPTDANMAPTPANLALLAQSQQMQQQYIQLVNQYQLAQLQQKLAQVDSQIAASKLTTTKSLVELKKLQPLLGSQAPSTGETTSSTSSNNNGPQVYQTMYVGLVSGIWQAMLQSSGQYFQVSIGMRLPDGSQVTQINSRGVIITTPAGVPLFLPMTKNLD